MAGEWRLVLITDKGEEYPVHEDMLSVDMTDENDRTEIIESVDEVLAQAKMAVVRDTEGPQH